MSAIVKALTTILRHCQENYGEVLADSTVCDSLAFLIDHGVGDSPQLRKHVFHLLRTVTRGPAAKVGGCSQSQSNFRASFIRVVQCQIVELARQTHEYSASPAAADVAVAENDTSSVCSSMDLSESSMPEIPPALFAVATAPPALAFEPLPLVIDFGASRLPPLTIQAVVTMGGGAATEFSMSPNLGDMQFSVDMIDVTLQSPPSKGGFGGGVVGVVPSPGLDWAAGVRIGD